MPISGNTDYGIFKRNFKWKKEIGWQNFRRIFSRFDKTAEVFMGFLNFVLLISLIVDFPSMWYILSDIFFIKFSYYEIKTILWLALSMKNA